MKKFIILIHFASACLLAEAQPDYPPSPLPAANFMLVEYFIDTDPGHGNGVQISLPSLQDVASFSFDASLSGISSGFHRIYLRTMDMNGKWSHTHNVFFDNYVVPIYAVAPAAAGNIIEAEYFIDTDPGFGNANKFSLSPGQDVAGQNISINVTGLSIGVHRFYVRTKDENNKWSLTHLGIFDNSFATPYPVAPAAAPPIGTMEYYFDTDPGFGNGTPLTVTAGTDIANLSVSVSLGGLAPGQHTLYIRSKQNPWSLSAYAEFMYASTLPLTWSYVKGEIRSNKGVISWGTAMEENTKEFVIEHSLDGQTFTSIGTVAAAGSSSVSQQYNFLHDALQNGANYYRIRQVDNDGKFSFSKIILLLNRNNDVDAIIAPNPIGDMLHLAEPTEKWVKKMELYDMSGKLVLSRTIETEGKVFSMQTASLNKGMYVLKVYYKSETKSFKIIKN